MRPDEFPAPGGRGPDATSGGQDLSAFWMPFTDNRYFKANPRLLARAEGMYYYTPEGRPLLDGVAGLWCVNAGHTHPKIVKAIQEQAASLDFAPTFQLGHPKAFELAERVAQVMPAGIDRIFFTNSGSESVDTALKIALAYHRAVGAASRYRLIGRERGYHGTNFGGTAVGGIGGNRRGFSVQLWGVDHLGHTHSTSTAFSRGQPQADGEHMAEELERLVGLHGAETIAAVIVEPVAGSTGVLIPPVGYLQRLREITARHGILLIFDEVITGFGRLGAATAAEVFGVVPDMITLAKGLTNGAVPMGGVAVRRDIYEAVLAGVQGPGIEFFHGTTYAGHPLAAAAGLATLDVYAEEGLFARAASLARAWEDAVHSLRDEPSVIDIRNFGLVAGVELSPREGAVSARGLDVFRQCFDDGFMVRVTGDTLALSPPLIISEEEIGKLIDGLRAGIRKAG